MASIRSYDFSHHPLSVNPLSLPLPSPMHFMRIWFTHGKDTGTPSFHIQCLNTLGWFSLHFFAPTSWKVLHSTSLLANLNLSDFCHSLIRFRYNIRTKRCALVLCIASVEDESARNLNSTEETENWRKKRVRRIKAESIEDFYFVYWN